MKSILMTLLSAFVIAQTGNCAVFSTSAESAYLENNSGVYLKAFSGVNLAREPRWQHAKYRTSTGYVVGATLGYSFNLVSLEGEFSYRHNTFDRLSVDALDFHMTGDIEQWCGFGNILLNLPMTSCFAPYIGVGAGYRHTTPGANFDESSDISIRNFIDTANEWGVYQGIAGFNFAVSKHVNLQLEYRYLDGFSNIRCRNHTADLSAVVRF